MPEPQQPDNESLVRATREATSVGRSVSSMTEAKALLDKSIVAKPLNAGEGFFNLKPKNPNVVFRAINRGVRTSDGISFLRYEQARAQGYINVTPNDVAGPVPSPYLVDGKIINGDLILMMIDKKEYYGALKWKDQQALRATQRLGGLEDAEKQIQRAADERGIPPKLARKLSPFIPNAKDIGGEE